MRSLLAVFVVASSLVIGQTKAPFDEALWAGMKARALGPATMSGRVAAIDVQPGTPRTIWVGAATGGLWRSRDLGLSFECVSDDWSAHSIGAVAVHQGQPQVIWVGMGEANPRNSAGWGLGVQLSTNGGETFHYVGLANTYNIARIIPDPRDARAAWVAALGNQWADSDDRGIYRTEDGGRTWTHQLALGPSVGAADLVIDPENPDHLLAAMWDFRREPHSFRSGGPGGGLHRSRDGGKSWDKLGTKEGLPKGDLGRIGLAFAPSNSRVVYAWVEATKENVLMRSDDGARSFRVVGRGDDIGNRPFYYADIHVDPKNPEVVYSLWSQVSRSTDGGKSFEVLIGWDDAHPDHHAFWIDPADPSFLIDGNDGGVAISRDRGENWRFVRTLPLAQLYHVRVDDALPYNIYFGLQDNGSWRGPAYTFEVGGIKNHHWRELCFGDGFDTAPVGDGRRGFAMSQEGHLVRWDLETGEQKSVRPLGPRDTDLRFNWNAGFAPDPFDDDTIWFGSQFVHRSKDLGDTWEIVSGDLTTNDPRYQRQKDSGGLTPDVTGAENYTTIVAIAPSPVEPGTVWVGSDDGRLHVTRDDGATWTSLETRLVGPPPGAWIPHIEASPHAAGTAFICVEDHRRGKHQAWVLRTDDFGATFRPLPMEGVAGYALSLVQDPEEPRLLFLGTELGLWISLDGGEHWQRFRHGVPTASVMDLAIQARDADLVVGTHGRGVFLIEDLRPLRAMANGDWDSNLRLFAPPTAYQARFGRPASTRFGGATEFAAPNRVRGARISAWFPDEALPLPSETTDDDTTAVLRIEDSEGRPVRRLVIKPHRGLFRFTWDLREARPTGPGEEKPKDVASDLAGPRVIPGRYRLILEYQDQRAESSVEVAGDPRAESDAAVLASRLAKLRRINVLEHALGRGLDRIREHRDDLAYLRKRLPDESDENREKLESLRDAIKSADESLRELEGQVRATDDEKGITSRDRISSRLRRVQGAIESHDGPVTVDQAEAALRGETDVREFLDELALVEERDLPPVRSAAAELNVVLLPTKDTLTIQ